MVAIKFKYYVIKNSGKYCKRCCFIVKLCTYLQQHLLVDTTHSFMNSCPYPTDRHLYHYDCEKINAIVVLTTVWTKTFFFSMKWST